MTTWISTDFVGHYPVGAAAVVIAPDADRAIALLSHELKRRGLSGKGFSVAPLNADQEGAYILVDGDY
jgi:hypothetical protein